MMDVYGKLIKMEVECRSLTVLDDGKNIIIPASSTFNLFQFISICMPETVKERIDVWIHEFSEVSIMEALFKFLPYEVINKKIKFKKGEIILHDHLISHLMVSLHCISMLDDVKFLYPEDIENIIF